MPGVFGALPVLPRRRVVVTGLGAVTPLGTTVAKTWHHLVRGVSSGKDLGHAPYFLQESGSTSSMDAVLKALPCRIACPVIDDEGVDGGPRSRFAPTAREPRSHRFCQTATEEALVDAGLLLAPADDTGAKSSSSSSRKFDDRRISRDRVAVNIGMGIPSLVDIAETARLLLHGPTVQYSKVHPFFVPKILGNMAAGGVALTYGFRGPIGSSVAACATGAHCIGEAARWIEEGSADVAIAGGTEACINPISIAGFCRMRALTTAHNDTPASASRPFDDSRTGFVMGEGAGLLVLEELHHAVARGAKIYAELRGFGCSSDAYHISAPDPAGYGARSCVASAMVNAGVDADDVAYVNAHATSTPIGDGIELAALESIFGSPSRRSRALHPVLVSSTKGSIGHLLGAAGSVEAVITVMSLHTKAAPPNVNLQTPIPHNESVVELPRGTSPYRVGGDGARVVALSTSFGFGGVNTALVFAQFNNDK